MNHYSSKRFALTWVLSLFGTAVGAGVLFLPINAGMGGFLPLVVMTLLVGPMTYLGISSPCCDDIVSRSDDLFSTSRACSFRTFF